MSNNNIEIENIEYPEDDDSFVESDDSELNPFQFAVLKHQDDKIELLFQAFINNRNQFLEVISDANHNLKKLRKYASQIQKEHQIFNVLKKAYEDLKHKTVNHDQFVISLEKGYEKQITELTNELTNVTTQMKTQAQEFEKQALIYKEQLSIKQEQLSLKEQEIRFIKENEIGLNQKIQQYAIDITKIQKENTILKKIKTQNFLDLNEKSDFQFSTFELIITTKIKPYLVGFLLPKDLLNLCMCKKSLYFAISQFKVLMPQAIRCKTQKMQSDINRLMKQIDQFRRLTTDCPEQIIKTQIIKYFDLNLNSNEWIDPIMLEAGNFIKGSQFLGRLEQLEDSDSTDGLKLFVQSMATRSQQTANLLRTEPFNLSQFTANLLINANERESFIKERTNQHKKLKTSQQDVQEKIFNLGTAVASDVGLYGLYLATMQRIFSSLYVFGKQLSTECRQQSSLIYYLALSHWEIIEKTKLLEQMNQDKQIRIQNNNNEIKALYDQIQGLKELIKNLQNQIKQKKQEFDNEQNDKQKIILELQETKQVLFNYGKNIKLLALEIRELRKINKDIVEQNNKAAIQICDLKSQVLNIEI